MSLKSKAEYVGKLLADKQSTRKAASTAAIAAVAVGLGYVVGAEDQGTIISLGAAFTAATKIMTGMQNLGGTYVQAGPQAEKTNAFAALKSIFKDAVRDEASTKKMAGNLVFGTVLGAITAALFPDAGTPYAANIMQTALTVGAGTAFLVKAFNGMENALDKRYGYVAAPKAAPAAPAAPAA